jgi:hypothetical protein
VEKWKSAAVPAFNIRKYARIALEDCGESKLLSSPFWPFSAARCLRRQAAVPSRVGSPTTEKPSPKPPCRQRRLRAKSW